MTYYETRVGLSVRQGDTEDFVDITAGVVTDQIPEVSVPWLLEQGCIVAAEAPQESTGRPADAVEGDPMHVIPPQELTNG